MFVALPIIAIFAALGYFAFIGIKTTFVNGRDSHGLIMIGDLFKYAALLIALIITYLGLSGLLNLLIDNQESSLSDKLDAARWLSFIFVGIPIIAILARWIRRHFTKNLGASEEPAWQIYLLAATTISFLLWFLSLPKTLEWFAGGPYFSSELSNSIIAFITWLIHLRLIKYHSSIIVNIHRFIGWFAGAIGLVTSSISILDLVISQPMALPTNKLQLQSAIILAIVSAPIALYYWNDFEANATTLEARIYRTFGGQAVPILFYTIAGTFGLHQILAWFFEDRNLNYTEHFNEVPQQIAVVVTLIPTMLFFRKLVSGYERDDVTRLFQYLISAGGTFAIALAAGAITAGLLDETDTDAVIFGVSILIVAGYTWYRQWGHCQFAVNIDYEGEHHSPIRRFYLLATIGIPTLVLIGSTTWLSYRIFEALLVGGVERLRFATPAGFLVGAGVVALYHLRVLQRERE